MKANSETCQAIYFGKMAYESIDSFDIHSIKIKCEKSVTLLGINIDYMLKIDRHVSEICQKAKQ